MQRASSAWRNRCFGGAGGMGLDPASLFYGGRRVSVRLTRPAISSRHCAGSTRGMPSVPSSGRGAGHRGGVTAALILRIRTNAYLTSPGQRFRRHDAAAHADRGENNDPTGTPDPLITAKHTERLDPEPAIREQCRHLPDGRGSRAATDVRGNPVANRPIAGTARASMRGGWVRYDKRRRERSVSMQPANPGRFSAPTRSKVWFDRLLAADARFSVAQDAPKGRS